MHRSESSNFFVPIHFVIIIVHIPWRDCFFPFWFLGLPSLKQRTPQKLSEQQYKSCLQIGPYLQILQPPVNYLQGTGNIWQCRWLQIFWKIVLPPSSPCRPLNKTTQHQNAKDHSWHYGALGNWFSDCSLLPYEVRCVCKCLPFVTVILILTDCDSWLWSPPPFSLDLKPSFPVY
jgi:hypothetical protein